MSLAHTEEAFFNSRTKSARMLVVLWLTLPSEHRDVAWARPGGVIDVATRQPAARRPKVAVSVHAGNGNGDSDVLPSVELH